jgi:hypothetical protein
MKLRTQTFPQVRQLLQQGGWFSPALLLALLALEIFGRQSSTDSYDTVGATALVLLGALVALRHRSSPLGWIGFLSRQMGRLVRFADRFKIEFGPDLRGAPPIPHKLPGSVFLIIGALLAWTAAAVAAWSCLPASWRSYAVQGSYTVYLAGMIILWGLLFASALGGIYFPFMLFNYLFPRPAFGPDEPKISRKQLAFLSGYGAAVVVACCFLPLWVVPASCGAVLAAAGVAALWPHKPDVQFIWRAGGSHLVWSITTPTLLWMTSTFATLLLLALVMTAAGGRVLGQLGGDADMPVTVMLGVVVGWLTPGLLLSAAIFVFLLWKHNPSRACRPSVHVSGDLAAAASPRISRTFRQWGWDVRFDPRPPADVDVRIRLVEPRHSQAGEFDPAWPLLLSIEDLQAGTVRERLERRDEIQKRRLLLRGLEKIFNHTKGRQFAGGSGYWLAPQLWFIPGLARDEVEDDREDAAFLSQTIGPPFHDVLHRHVRAYFYKMLRALQVDLIFIEDGVDFRKLKKVLRVMFEVFDKSAGQRRAEEVQFQGLPKVKVLIHDFQLDEPFRSKTYPEPRFDDLGRARILHVFRDRGDNEEYLEPPFDFSSSPVPLYA